MCLIVQPAWVLISDSSWLVLPDESPTAMQVCGAVQPTAANSQTDAPGTLGVSSISQLAPAACTVTNTNPAPISDPASAIGVTRRSLSALLIVPVRPVITFSSRNDQLARVTASSQGVCTTKWPQSERTSTPVTALSRGVIA